MARQCLKPKRKRDAMQFRETILLVEAQGNGKVLNEEELEFLADPSIAEGHVTQSVIIHNAAYQADDLDAYDSDCDDISTAKAVLMANFSCCRSDVLFEDINSSAQQDALILSVFEQLSNQVTNSNKKAQEIRPVLYDGSVITKETTVISIADSEETLMLEEESRSKMLLKQSDPMVLEKKVNIKPINYAELNRLFKDFDKHFVPQQELSDDQVFWLQTSQPNTEQSASSPVKFEAPQELSKTFDKDLLKEITEIQSVFNQMEAAIQQYQVDKRIKNDLRKLKGKEIVDNATTIALKMYKLDPVTLAPYVKNNREAHKYYLKHNIEQAAILRELLGCVRDTYPDIHKPSEKLVAVTPINKKKIVRFVDTVTSSGNIPKVTNRPLLFSTRVNPSTSSSRLKPSGNTNNDRISQTPSSNEKNKVEIQVLIHLEVVAPKQVVTRVYTRRPEVPKSVQNSKPKVAKSMTANRMELDTSRGSDTSVAPSSSSLIDCRDMMVSSLICLLSKATKTKSWLWHRRLSYLNFGVINHLARHSLVCGLPKLKFEKDHLCYACAMGKSKKQSHKLKFEDTNQEKLYLLHMDFCGPMRVASVNGKRYILFIVDDYSWFTWVKFLASMDEAPDFIIKLASLMKHRLHELHNKMVLLKGEIDLMFQLVFDEFSPLAIVASPVHVEEAPAHVELTDLPSSTTVDQDAPSPSTSQTTPQSQSQIIPLCVEKESHDLEVKHMSNDPYFGIPIPEIVSEESSSSDVISTTAHSEHLRLQISQSPRGIFLNQSKYALESLKKYKMVSCDPVDTPMMEKSKLDEDTEGKTINSTHYRGMVSTLMYLTSSRPDLVLWYSKDSAIALTVFADADHTVCQDTRHSTSGSMQLLGDRHVSWSLKRQKSAVISSTEAEYIALSGCCAQVLWLRLQLLDYGLGFNKILIYHFIKEQVENGVVEHYFVRTKFQLANIFTKALCRERIEFLIDKLRMRSFTPETLKELADKAEE
uniref:GAG-pre-integrase domain-containing protein n=1 Tax=Tanacetum cinerariifolium TaxID=118510 RepID=A0A6L2L6M6_TANCI|nr:hypothetical protein [Tanacetum cinerariifolium]